jgi:hypothetical protein
MQKGGNLAQVYKRLVTVSNDISSWIYSQQ